jgi:hypothetical protein
MLVGRVVPFLTFAAVAFALSACGQKKSTSGEVQSYQLSFVAPNSVTNLALDGADETKLSYSLFDSNGEEVSTGELPFALDGDVLVVNLSAMPDQSVAVRYLDGSTGRGAYINAPGFRPETGNEYPQVALTGTGFIAAKLAALANPSDRPFIIADLVSAYLPASAMNNLSDDVLKDIARALAEVANETPAETLRIYGKRTLESGLNIKEMISGGASLDEIEAAKEASHAKIIAELTAAESEFSVVPVFGTLKDPATALSGFSELFAAIPADVQSAAIANAMAVSFVNKSLSTSGAGSFDPSKAAEWKAMRQSVEAGALAAQASNTFAAFSQAIAGLVPGDSVVDPEDLKALVIGAISAAGVPSDTFASFSNSSATGGAPPTLPAPPSGFIGGSGSAGGP